MENTQNYNEKLFWKIWRNKILRYLIFKFNILFYQILFCRKSFKSIKEFLESNEKYKINSIKIDCYRFTDLNEILRFLKYDLPENIENIEFSNCIIKFNSSELIIPNSLKSLKFTNTLNKTHLIHSKYSASTPTISTSTKSNIVNPFKSLISTNNKFNLNTPSISETLNNLRVFGLGNYLEHFLVDYQLTNLNNLKHLVLSHQFSTPILNGMLPKQLHSLTIKSVYPFEVLYLPPNLKRLEFGKGDYKYSSILNGLPNSLETLVVYCHFKTSINWDQPSNQLIRLKKLKLSDSFLYSNSITTYYSSTFQKTNHLIDHSKILENLLNYKIFSELVSLKLCIFDDIAIRNGIKLDPDSLPNTLIKLKIPNIVSINSQTTRGLPKSLKSIECTYNQLLSFKFQDYSNLDSLKLYYTIFQDESHFIDLSNFYQLKSLCFKFFGMINQKFIDKFKIIQPLNNLKNLELNLDNEFFINNAEDNDDVPGYGNNNNITIQQINNIFPIKPIENLVSLKLSTNYTKELLRTLNTNSHFNHSDQLVECPFPNSIKLLDIELNYLIPDEWSNTFLNEKLLPSSIEILIIRGSDHPNIILPLPPTLQSIFVSNHSKLLSNKDLVNQLSKYVKVFDFELDQKYLNGDFETDQSNSKLYNYLNKKYI